MSLRDNLQKRIDAKQSEIAGYEEKIRSFRGLIAGAKIYIEALEEVVRLLPREPANDGTGATLRPGTNLEKARDAIRDAGKPLHITELLGAIGMPVDDENRSSLSGSIGAYVRKGQVFTRPAPNTFGLLESDAQKGPPPGFGADLNTPKTENEPDSTEES